MRARDLEAPGGGARAKLEDQGHAKQVAHASQPTLRSASAEREAVPVTSDAERSLSDARGAVSGSSSKGNKNAYKHGRYSGEEIARRREITALLTKHEGDRARSGGLRCTHRIRPFNNRGLMSA